MSDVREWAGQDTARLLRVPGADDDKYSRGVVALRTGSERYPGAAVLGVEAAWRSGAGYVCHLSEGRAADAVIARRPETVTGMDLGHTRPDAWVIGSGTDAAGRSDDEEAALRAVLAGSVPVVVDAGALDLAIDAGAPSVLTPHDGEFRRLLAQLGILALEDRAIDALAAAAACGQTIVRKGASTLVAGADGTLCVVSSAPGWLATAGSGDVLAGVIGSLLAANPTHSVADVAAGGVWLHGHAARLASGAVGGRPGRPIVALDVAEALPLAIADLLT